jgi:acetate---CoA ligase (ADP-forming)
MHSSKNKRMDQASSFPCQGNLEKLLRPKSIAIVGASQSPGSFGASVLANLDRAAYGGQIYLVNPKRESIGERPCLASIDFLPEGVDCAVLAIPRQSVLEAVRVCARRKVGAVVIFSAGFAEAGAEGLAEQQAIREIALTSRMVIEGPNCLGMVNYVDGIPLTFVVTEFEKNTGADRVAIVSQSGAMAAVLSVSLRSRMLPLSFSVSTGNEAASGAEDFVEYMIHDPNTRVIVMIVEQFRNPKRFLALAEVAQRQAKHIVLLHPGVSSAARGSAATHTGAMAGNYEVMKAKVTHAGVLLVQTLEELVDVTDILIRCASLPHGGTLVFTESGAFKALALDLCESIGLGLPQLASDTVTQVKLVLPDFIQVTNPLDLTAQGLVDPDLYRRVLPPVLADESFGSIVLAIILTDQSTSRLKFQPILQALREIRPNKAVVFAALDEGVRIDPGYVEELRALHVPFFPSAERAFRALARVSCFADKVDEQHSAEMKNCDIGMRLESGVIAEYKTKRLLDRLGVRIPRGGLARTLEDAQTIAAKIGFPVVLKAQTAELSHKSDVGGVVLNLNDTASVAEAWTRMTTDIAKAFPDLDLDGILVEQMAMRGMELIVGARNDPDWGPVILLGCGGILAEALNDMRLIVPGLSNAAITRELLQLKSAALLQGFRGSPALDVGAVADIVSSLSKLILCAPRIQEIEINPVVVYAAGDGAIALDALMTVA